MDHAPFAQGIAGFGRFDLDDVGAEVGADHPRQWSGEHSREIEQTESLERQARAEVGLVERPDLIELVVGHGSGA